MGMLAKIGEVLLGKPDKTLTRTALTDDFLRGGDLLWSSPTVSGMQISQITALNVSAVLAAVTIIAEDVAKLTPTLIRKNDQKRIEVVTDHPLAKLLIAPNDYMSGFEFIEMLVLGVALRGNGYAVKIKNYRGEVVAMIPINPDSVALWQAVDGSLFYLVTPNGYHERALLANEPFLIPSADMFTVRGFSLNGLQGASRIHLAREAIGLALGQEQQAARWMGNAAKPAGVLSTEQKLDDPTIARLKENWVAANAGVQNSGKTAILEAGVTWQQVAMTGQDIEFIASRNFQLNEICRIWRVPAHMIGELSRSTNNNIVQQAQEYANLTLSGYTQRLRWSFIRSFDLTPLGIDVQFDMKPILQGDITSRYNAHRIAIMSGFKTPNEVRHEEGLEPAENGDKLMFPTNMAEAGSQATGTQPDESGRPAEGSQMAAFKRRFLGAVRSIVGDALNRNGVGEEEAEETIFAIEGEVTRQAPKVRYSPDQPRDDHGRFGDGSGEGEAAKGTGGAAVALYEAAGGASAKSAADIIAGYAGGAEAIAAADARVNSVPSTDKTVAEGGFKNADGTWTAERAALHTQIVDKVLSDQAVAAATPAAGEPPTLTVLGGRGGSGKSFLTGPNGPVNPANAILLDADAIKGMLPEYAGWNAGQLHEESSAILDMIDRQAVGLGVNIIHDATMKSEGTISQRMALYENAGYKVEGHYMFASPEVAATRAMGRFAKGGTFTGRYVPISVILGNTKNEANFDKMSPRFSAWSIWDNNAAGGSPKLVAKG